MSRQSKQTQSKLIADAVSRVLCEGLTAGLVTLIEAPEGVGRKLLVEESGESEGSLGDFEFDRVVRHQASSFLESREEARVFPVEQFAPELSRWVGARVLFERLEPEPHVVICGAGHVGASLARLAALIGYRATLIDDREDFLKRELFPDRKIELVPAESLAGSVQAAIGNGRGVSVAVVTRGHKEDEECLRAVMSSNPDYIGLIGSKRRTNFVLEKLREEGVDEARLRKVRGPIGLDIGAVSPEEVALAILAEIVAERRGGSGAPLSAWRRTVRGAIGT